MSIKIVYGRAGTGKSTFCLNEIKKQINQAQKIFIIVPEQFSYATEKKLLETLESKSSVNAEVISFKRLAYKINQEVGKDCKNHLTKAGKEMLLKFITNKNKQQLNFLGKTNDIDLILRIITELKKHNINVETLDEQINNLEQTHMLLKLKLEDISKVFSLYQEAIVNGFIDEEDSLTILANQIKNSHCLDNALIYIDEFAGFTVQEYLVIEEILKKANKATFTICTDTLENNSIPENDIFFENKKTVKKLLEHAKNAKCKIEDPIKLEKIYRFKNEELKIIETNLFKTKNDIYINNVKNIHLKVCKNPYIEIEETAKKIIEQVREKKIRYKDISIIAKNMEEYIAEVNVIFAKYKIPVFIDTNKGLNNNILIKYVLSLFEILKKGWTKDSVLAYAKTGFLNLTKQDIYKLENYCNKWQIRGSKWYKEDWKYDEQTKDLEKLNRIRKTIVNPLVDLNNELRNKKNAKEITKKIYEFLEQNEIKNKLNEKIKKLNNEQYENEYIACYNTLIDILDEISIIFDNQKLTYEEYTDILKQGLEVSTFRRNTTNSRCCNFG